MEFAQYLFTVFPDGYYYRITSENDPVVDSPCLNDGYRHAGHEVWFPKRSKEAYKECKNDSTKEEDRNCNGSLHFKMGIEAHTTYFGKMMDPMCKTHQPSNTLKTPGVIENLVAMASSQKEKLIIQ